MVSSVIRIYEFLRKHKVVGIASFLLITLGLVLLVSRQTYKEDISDFLPLDSRYHEAMDVFQQTSGANRIFGVFQMRDYASSDPDRMSEAIECFEENLEENDPEGQAGTLMTQLDLAQMTDVMAFVYDNIPYFITDSTAYDQMRQQLADPHFVENQLAADKQKLMFPVGGVMTENIGCDPLDWFAPVVGKLQGKAPAANYEVYDDHVFSPDMSRAFIMLHSPFGSSETEQNGKLLKLLERTATQTMAEFRDVDIHFTGGPVIAVGNASQIVMDSVIAVALAVLIILLILFSALRSWRNIILIIVSVAWGWLVAMGALSLFHNNVSIIVIGISSAIIGIAVNYPLHLIAHLRHTPDRIRTLKEIVTPLIVGNITTVGAFLALVPLQSIALRDLGLFAAFLLIGTIMFVLIYLPHVAKNTTENVSTTFADRIGSLSLENKKWIPLVVGIITLVMLWFSFSTSFDSNLSHINYMTDEQKADMEYMQKLVTKSAATTEVYAVVNDADADSMLQKSQRLNDILEQCRAKGLVEDFSSISALITSKEVQRERLDRWRNFVSDYGEEIEYMVRNAARKQGFADDSFEPFFQTLRTDFQPRDIQFFSPLLTTLYETELTASQEVNDFRLVNKIRVDEGQVDAAEQAIRAALGNDVLVFDMKKVNSTIANNLSDNFNYIGWACGLIVFCFLWFSFGCLELAILSFIPMAVSWIWILGIMSMLGLQFNVVNVILATFIFGQGDDYTIFMTEGCQYEYAYRKKMLASYKSSIIISALVMFVGIGTLILAKHPALHSLAVLTIVGMFSVVLMAYLFPPLIFKWLVMKNGAYRVRPLSFSRLVRNNFAKVADTDLLNPDAVSSLVTDRYRYKGTDVTRSVKRQLRKKTARKYLSSSDENTDNIVVVNSGYGAFALAYALMHPKTNVWAFEADFDKVLLARYSAEGIVSNLTITDKADDEIFNRLNEADTRLFLLSPNKEDCRLFSDYQNTII